ncbi:AAA family ATPase [Flindersiella endophytica]
MSARVHLLCGLVGAGKTTCARRLAADLPAVRFSPDEWMLRQLLTWACGPIRHAG